MSGSCERARCDQTTDRERVCSAAKDSGVLLGITNEKLRPLFVLTILDLFLQRITVSPNSISDLSPDTGTTSQRSGDLIDSILRTCATGWSNMVEIWMDRGSMEHQIRIGHVNKLEQRSKAYQEIRGISNDFFSLDCKGFDEFLLRSHHLFAYIAAYIHSILPSVPFFPRYSTCHECRVG